MDPHFAQWFPLLADPFKWSIFGMSAQQTVRVEPSSATVKKAIEALHIGITVALAVFAWNMIEARIADNREKAVMRTEIDALKALRNPEVIDAVQTTRIEDLLHRVDLLSVRIDKLTEQQAQHIQHDNDRFQRAPSYRGQQIP